FTDLANTTSNQIYAIVRFRRFADWGRSTRYCRHDQIASSPLAKPLTSPQGARARSSAGLASRSHQPHAEPVSRPGHERHRRHRRAARAGTHPALAAAEAFPNAAHRRCGRRQRPEEHGHLLDQAAATELQMIAELESQAIDAGVSD